MALTEKNIEKSEQLSNDKQQNIEDAMDQIIIDNKEALEMLANSEE